MSDDALDTSHLMDVVRRYYPPDALDIDPGYESLPEVQARRAAQAQASRDPAPRDRVATAIRACWPDAKMLDHSTPHLDAAWHLRIVRDGSPPARQLVVLLGFLAPVALVYEADATAGRPPILRAPAEAIDQEGARTLEHLVTREGFRVLSPDMAQTPCPGIAAGNLLPGEVTLADALLGPSRW